MRITIVNSFFPPWRGGAETYVLNLSRTLVRRGHEVTVHCGDDPLPSGSQMASGVMVVRHRVLGRVYGTPVMPTLLAALQRTKSDVLHANFPSPYIAFLVAATSKTRKIPAVLTWHNDLPAVTSGARLLVEAHDRLFLPKYLGRYRSIISTSAAYAARSTILRRFPQLVRVVPNGVDCQRFHPGVRGHELRRTLNIGDEFTSLFVGALTRWHRYKGLHVLLAAYREIISRNKRNRLIVVGDGEQKASYMASSDALGLSANVTFAGNVDDSILPQYYAASDVVVLPSMDMSEGFGLTLLEANATGKPVVASDVGGIPSIVTNGYNGLLVPPNDPRALAEALLSLAANWALTVQMGRKGRKVAERHDWNRTVALTERVYQDALE